MTILLLLAVMAALFMVSLIFRAAAYALPVYAGVGLAIHLAGAGYGYAAAAASGLASGIMLLELGRLLAAHHPSKALQLVVVAIFTVPAGIAGYQAGRSFGGLLVGEGAVLTLASVLSGLVAATSAWRSLAVPVEEKGSEALPPSA